MPSRSAGSASIRPNQACVGTPLNAATVYALSCAIDPDSSAAPSSLAKASKAPARSTTAMFTGTPRACDRAAAVSTTARAPAYVRVCWRRTDGDTAAVPTTSPVLVTSAVRVTGSGQDRGEPFVQLTGVVEDALAQLVWCPDAYRAVGVGRVAAREDLVAVAGGVEEVDGLPPCDAVTGRAHVDRHVVHGEEVCGVPDLVPVGELEREVVEFALRSGDDCELVDLVAACHPGADVVAVGLQRGLHALRGVEPEGFGQEAFHALDVLGRDEGVVERRDSDPDEVAGEGLGVVRPDLGADHCLAVVDLEQVVGRGVDTDAVGDVGVVALGHALDDAAERLGLLLDVVDVELVLHLEAELDQPDAAFLEDDRVVVPLVPALVVDPAVLLQNLIQAKRVGVMVLGLGHVSHAHMRVAHPHDAHICYSLDSVPLRTDLARRRAFSLIWRRKGLMRRRSSSRISMVMSPMGTARQVRHVPSVRSPVVRTESAMGWS